MTGFSKWQKSTKVLTLIIIAILLIIIFLTALALATGNFHPGQNLRKADPEPAQVLKRPESSKLNAYTDFGQIRIKSRADSKDKNGSIIVVAPWFSYEKEDIQLFEEISNKELLLKSLISDYFKNFTIDELNKKGEVQVKTELLHLINSNLVLGKIRAIYFSDYKFIQ